MDEVMPTETPEAGGGDAPVSSGLSGGSLLSTEETPVKPSSSEESRTLPAPDSDSIPDHYELQAPEGSAWNEAQMTAFHGQAKDLGLTQTQAQKLLDMAHGNQQQAVELHQQQVARWDEEARMDASMGGPQYATTVMYAKAGLKAFDPDNKVFGLLKETGYGNHPEVLRFLSLVGKTHGKTHGEDTLATGSDPGGILPLEDRLYRNMKV